MKRLLIVAVLLAGCKGSEPEPMERTSCVNYTNSSAYMLERYDTEDLINGTY
jgi:hypothetical protein